MIQPPSTVRQLRSRWKPAKERLAACDGDHPLPIRIHRACSWLGRVEAMEDQADLDLVLVCKWIAFNSLYGRWNEDAREPAADRPCWRRFVDHLLELDVHEVIPGVLIEHRRLVMTLLDDPYLTRFFWEEPSDKRAGKATKAKYDARTWYLEKRWSLLLDRLLERIYLMRCQLVHGAATFGSRLNRTSLRRCCIMMGHLVPAFLVVVIDHGDDQDWGPLCYPPLT